MNDTIDGDDQPYLLPVAGVKDSFFASKSNEATQEVLPEEGVKEGEESKAGTEVEGERMERE
jgi:hypothetical protein